MIDLSALAPPQVVEPLNFEQVLATLKTELLAAYPAAGDVIELESEPLVKLLQVVAYREVLLRQRVNEAARSVMLAHAVGTDLDHLGANWDVARLPGEDDARLRHRVQQGFNRLAAAGPADAYRQHALGVSAAIADVDVFSEAPGAVTVAVLARRTVPASDLAPDAAAVGQALFGLPPAGSSGTAQAHAIEPTDGPLLRAVLDAVNAEQVRPLTDQVVVRAPSVLTFEVRAVVQVLPGPDAALILARRRQALQAHLASVQRMGYDITRAGLIAALVEPGVKNVRLLQPAVDLVCHRGEIAACTAISLSTEVVDA